MFFEPKPEFSAVVKGGYNCRAFSPVRTIGGAPVEPSYTPPLVKVLLGDNNEELEDAYEAFASKKGRLILAIGEAQWTDGRAETDTAHGISAGFNLTVIYQERVTLGSD